MAIRTTVNNTLFQKYALFGIGLLLMALVWYCKDAQVESDYFTPKALATHFNGEQFVGSATCMECHSDIYASHIQTAHYNTSAQANAKNIKGSFQKGRNTLELQDAHITMTANKGSFYQRTDIKFSDEKSALSKLDITIGSGVKGQSYLSWKDDGLYQLQASFYTPTDQWINSPNFSKASTNRPISDACLKCHLTFAKNIDFSGNGNHYIRENMVYGIDCERCHRPAAKHVVYHRANPEATASKFMMLSDTLSRQQRLDACVQCHSGLRAQQLKGNPFSFLPGEKLAAYSKNYYTGRPNTELDVHGNQYGLLASSACFKESPQLDCTTCHDPHKNQRGNTIYFNQKCASCHNGSTVVCKAPATETSLMGNNCIACHMPLSPSNSMRVQLARDSIAVPVYVRTHLIQVYSESAGDVQ